MLSSFGNNKAAKAEEEETEDATEFRNGSRNLHYLHVNRMVKGRTCRACHDFHAGNNPKHIADAVPFGEWSISIPLEFTPTGRCCLPGCHHRYRYDRNEPVNNLPTP